MARYHFPAASKASGPDGPARSVAVPVVQCQSALETKFPHVLATIQALWGFKELQNYFSKLMIDERGGRAGFPPEVWDELHTLLYLHQELVPSALFEKDETRHASDFHFLRHR